MKVWAASLRFGPLGSYNLSAVGTDFRRVLDKVLGDGKVPTEARRDLGSRVLKRMEAQPYYVREVHYSTHGIATDLLIEQVEVL